MQQGRRLLSSRRRFDYDRAMLPNRHLASLEPDEVRDLRSAGRRTAQTMGYPAWNLLYYALFCSLPPDLADPVVVETGTNWGLSTVVMAQALKDLGLNARVETVDNNTEVVELARRNVEAAGISNHVSFHVQDSLSFLRELVQRRDYIDFAFLDDAHSYEHVAEEVEIIHPKVCVRSGKVYFDNSSTGGVARALEHVRRRFGGNLIEFGNSSWSPPGNAIWQP